MNLDALIAKKRCDELLKNTWNIIKKDLANGIIKYNDIDRILQYKFMKQFDDMFTMMEKSFEIPLSKIKYLYRAAGEKANNYERMIPKIEFASLNRFNPPEEVFIYLGISDNKNSVDGRFNIAEKTCLEEIRAKKGLACSICEFQIVDFAKSKKIIDIGIADKYTNDELIGELLNEKVKLSHKNYRQNREDKERLNEIILEKKGSEYLLAKIMAKLYFKMISDNLFVPIKNVQDKKYEYAPFHAFANYFRIKGYAGIIYKSTIYDMGKNLVLFNVGDVKYIQDSMRYVIY